MKDSSTPMVIVGSTSLVGNGVYANTAFQELTGYTTADFLSHGLEILHGEETDPQSVAPLQTALSRGRNCAFIEDPALVRRGDQVPASFRPASESRALSAASQS